MRKLRDAGAIILGKTTLPDFATSWFSYSSLSEETKNPYASTTIPAARARARARRSPRTWPRSASARTAAARSALPGSFCGLVGVRSTPGVVPRTGSSYLVIFQDTIGPMTRPVADAATVFDVLAGYDESDPYTAAYMIARAPRELPRAARRGRPAGRAARARR